MNVFYVLVYLTLSLTTGLDDNPYCSIRYRRLCQGKGLHVGCQFPEDGPGESCQNYSPINFHNDLKHFITHYINRRRQRIAAGIEKVRGGIHLPKPEIMMMVEWDRELAMLAQRLADQCIFGHDDCRATVRYPYAGQSVGEVRLRRTTDSEALTVQRAIRRVLDAWWGERRRVLPHHLTQPFKLTKGAVWGHFSQLAVWSLRAVGCGATRHGVSYTRMLLLCDFSHTNMLGQQTLKPGPMRPCPEHTARQPRSAYPLLCAPIRYKVRTEEYDFDSEDQYELIDDDDENPPKAEASPLLNVSRAVMKMKMATKDRSWRNNMKASTEMLTDVVIDDELPRGNGFIIRSTQATELSSNGVFFDKFDQQLDKRFKAQHKDLKFIHRQSTTEQLWRKTLIDEYTAISTKHKMNYQTRLGDVGEDSNQKYVNNIDYQDLRPMYARHKWQQIRNRPQRPGASALLHLPISAHTHRSSIAAMTLDKEDVVQLFRDTGFNSTSMGQRV